MKKLLFILLTIVSIQANSQTTLTESFEGTQFPNQGWNIYSPNNGLTWSKVSDMSHTGNSSIYHPRWNSSFIVTPLILVGSSTDSLSFWTNYNCINSTGVISIYTSTTGNTYNDIDTSSFIYRVITSGNSNGWIKHSISLNNYIGQNIYIHIKYDSWRTDMYIDDIRIPNNTSSIHTDKQTNVTQSSATLNGSVINSNEITNKGFIWRNASANTWNTVNVSSDTLKYTLYNLTADTKYEYKAFTHTNTDTLYGNLEYFYTDYSINTTYPLFESFEDSIFPSNGWANLADASINLAWDRSSDLSKTGNYSAFRAYWNSSWLVSPLVKIQDNFDTLSFWYNASTYSGSSAGIISIFISDYCNFDTCRDLSNLISQTIINSENGWVNLKIPLTKYNNKKVYIGIKYDSWMWQMYLDDISGVLYTQNPLSLIRYNINPEFSTILYPNPASKETTLSIDNINGLVIIVIKDIQGKIIKTIKEKANNSLNKIIDISQLPKGEYFISIINKDIQQTKKLIIQ